MQIINCTYRGSRARYYVSKPYPYYATEQMTTQAIPLDGTLQLTMRETSIETEELIVGAMALTSELRGVSQTYNVSTGAIDGSIPATSGNAEALTAQITMLSGTLVVILRSHTQPIDEMLTALLTPLTGTLVQVLVTQSQPTEAIEATLTALNGTLV